MSLSTLYTIAQESYIQQKAPQFNAGWAASDAYNVVTMCKGDTRNKRDSLFNMYLPVDDTIIGVSSRTENQLSGSERVATNRALSILHLMPVFSFMIVARIMSTDHLHTMGEAYDNNDYWEISVEAGKFKDFANILADVSDEKYTTALAYVMPAFLFGNVDLINNIWTRTRDDTKNETKYIPNEDTPDKEQKWHIKNPPSILDIAHRAGNTDSIRDTLFSYLEHNIDDALDLYTKYVNSRGSSREEEILRNADQIKNELAKHIYSNTIPEWWPTRLIDYKLNALLPGKNVWYFRNYFIALSYVWENGGTQVEGERPMFSSGGIKTYKKEAYTNMLKIAKEVDISAYIWIDALCIDQTNDTEKSIEVARSPAYYRYSNKCIVMPTGLSNIISLKELSTQQLPRWFSRAWTLLEAVSADFIIGVFKEGYFDRYEMLSYLDNNYNQSGVSITSARSIMRRGALATLRPSEVLQWALARDATREEDIINAIVSLLAANSTSEIPIIYDVSVKDRIFAAAKSLSGSSRTSLVTLSGNGWLPMVIKDDEYAGIVINSELDSAINDNKQLIIKNTELVTANNTKIYKKIIPYNVTEVRHSNQSGIMPYIRIICNTSMPGKDGPAEEEIIRAWIAIVYMSSDIVLVEHDSGEVIARIITMKGNFTHLVFVGYSEDSIYLEKVYVCATISKDGTFNKVGIIAEPVGTRDQCNNIATDVIIANSCNCDRVHTTLLFIVCVLIVMCVYI